MTRTQRRAEQRRAAKLARKAGQSNDLLLTTLIAEHKPANTTECLLVTSMAQHRWLLDRATRLQETTLDPQTTQVTDQKLFSLYLRYATTDLKGHLCQPKLK